MKIGFIGGGKVGFSLGKYLKENNFDVVGYFSKNVDSIKGAANFTNTKEFYSLKEILSESDILFITTTDSEIESVWENLKKLSIKNKIICHCSGALSSEIFKGRENYNVFGYSVHPLFPIKDKYESYKSLKEAVFTVEGDETYINIIISMFSSIGNKVKEIKKEYKINYNKSAVLVSNLVLALISIGVDELESCGFYSDEALDSLYPLIKNNIKNIKEKGLYEALTGPVERGDLEIVKKHLEASTGENKAIYKLLSKKLLEIGKKKNENKYYKEMEDFLCK